MPAGWSLSIEAAAACRRDSGSMASRIGSGPFALAHVEQRGAAGVAVFHGLLAGEPEIQVVVRQQHRGAGAGNSSAHASSARESSGAVKPGRNGVAERADGRLERRRASRVISSHSAAVEVSHQSLAGRMTSPASSSGTKPCCWPLTPMPRTRGAVDLGGDAQRSRCRAPRSSPADAAPYDRPAGRRSACAARGPRRRPCRSRGRGRRPWCFGCRCRCR